MSDRLEKEAWVKVDSSTFSSIKHMCCWSIDVANRWWWKMCLETVLVKDFLANLVTYVCTSNLYRVTIKYEYLEGFLTKHKCIQMQSYGQVSLRTYQKPNVPTPPNNAVWQCYCHDNSIENTCILHYRDQENPYLIIHTHLYFCLSITGNRVFIYMCYKNQKDMHMCTNCV